MGLSPTSAPMVVGPVLVIPDSARTAKLAMEERSMGAGPSPAAGWIVAIEADRKLRDSRDSGADHGRLMGRARRGFATRGFQFDRSAAIRRRWAMLRIFMMFPWLAGRSGGGQVVVRGRDGNKKPTRPGTHGAESRRFTRYGSPGWSRATLFLVIREGTECHPGSSKRDLRFFLS